MDHHSQHGRKIGPRIAMLMSQAMVTTHQKLLGTKHKLAMIIFRAISDEISEEVDITLGPILTDMKARYGEDGPVASLLDFMANGHGQWKAIVGSAASVSGILSSVAMILNNELFPAVYETIATNPHLVPDQGTIAQMAAMRVLGIDDANFAMAKNGYDGGWAESMIQMNLQYPSPVDSVDMLRRGILTEAEFVINCQRNGVPDTMIDAYMSTRRQPVSPADAALAFLRSNIGQGEAEAIAAEWGIDAASFAILVGNSGEPLGLMQLLEAYRRKFISRDDLIRGIKESRVRDEWITTAEALRFSPMSVSDAVNAVVQDQLDMATAADISEQNGLEPGAFQTLVNTAGEPLARGEMLQLYNRGLVTQAQVMQALRESRLKNKYNGMAFLLHERLLEPRELSSAVEFGSITQEQAIQQAMAYGYSHELATVLIGEGQARKIQTYKNKVISSLETLYEDGAIDAPTATAAMEALNITETEAAFIIEAADMRRAVKQSSQVISAVRSKFLARHIDDQMVTQLLTTAGVPQTQIAFLLSEWQIEQQAATRVLTEAQIVKAVKLSLITPDDGATRLVNMGYSEPDAQLLIDGA